MVIGMCAHIRLNMGPDARKPDFDACVQHRRRTACSYMQSDQHLCFFAIFAIWKEQ